MSELIVVGFDDKHRAAEVLAGLRRLDQAWVADLEDAAIAVRMKKGGLRIQHAYDIAEGQEDEGTLTGGMWGALIGGLLAIPFTGGLSAGGAAAAFLGSSALGTAIGATGGALSAEWWQEDFGISDEFAKGVAKSLQPGGSALFVRMSSYDPQFVVDALKKFGGTVLSTSLTRDQDQRLQDILDGKESALLSKESPMSKKFQELKTTLADKAAAARARVESTGRSIGESLRAKGAKVRADIESRATKIRSSIAAQDAKVRSKKEELKARFAEFKAERATQHAAKRAQRAAEYAAICFDDATVAIVEAEAAALDAIEAQMAAEESEGYMETKP